MALEDKFAQHDHEVVDKYHDPNAAYQMTTRDYVLRPSADGVSGPIIITLPPVADAKGRWYSIVARQAEAVNTITVQDNNNDSECWLGDLVLNGKCDRLLLYSDGLCWYPGTLFGWPGFSTTSPPGTSEPPSTAPVTERQSTAPPTTTETTAAG